MSETSIATFSLDGFRELLQQCGYRVEIVDAQGDQPAFLRSSTAGLAFDIRPGSLAAEFTDATFLAGLQVQGELPLDMVNRWNASRRFARLHLMSGFLVLSMDISIFGGVTPGFVRSHVEIWDRLIQDLVPYLRQELQALGAAAIAHRAATADETRLPVSQAKGAKGAKAGDGVVASVDAA
jgi:hypothetical protein